jgi:hypothetical protein
MLAEAFAVIVAVPADSSLFGPYDLVAPRNGDSYKSPKSCVLNKRQDDG